MIGLVAGFAAGAVLAIFAFLSLRSKAPKTITVNENLHLAG